VKFLSNKPNNKIIDSEIYGEMLNSSVTLFKFIKEKQKLNLPITEEEADWANNFFNYAKELNNKMKENGLS
jgi:hypothetical protein